MHKIAFQLGAWPVTWFGICVATAFLAGLWTASRRGLRDNLAPETILDLGPWLIIGSVLGARTLYVTSYWNEYFAGKPWTEVFKIYEGGLVYYGGLIGATAAGLIFVYRRRLPVWKVADTLAPSISLGQMFGRVGCLMNGCCYGRETQLPWAIHFPKGHEKYGLGLHPTQLYEASLSLVLFGALSWLYRRKKFDGQVFATYLLAYAVVRAFVESFRGDYPQLYLGGWATPAHIVSAVVFVVGLALYLALSTRKKQASPTSAIS